MATVASASNPAVQAFSCLMRGCILQEVGHRLRIIPPTYTSDMASLVKECAFIGGSAATPAFTYGKSHSNTHMALWPKEPRELKGPPRTSLKLWASTSAKRPILPPSNTPEADSKRGNAKQSHQDDQEQTNPTPPRSHDGGLETVVGRGQHRRITRSLGLGHGHPNDARDNDDQRRLRALL